MHIDLRAGKSYNEDKFKGARFYARLRRFFMKKFIVTVLLVGLLSAAFIGCGGSNNKGDKKDPPKDPTYYTVTFKQDGQSDVTRSVEEGAALTDIPTPASVKGYTVVWDKGESDFAAITADMTVNAVATANTYTITFDYGDSGFVGPETLSVTYDAEFAFPTDTAKVFEFEGVKWVLGGTGTDTVPAEEVVAGVYQYDRDITIVFTYTVKHTWQGTEG